MEKVLPLTLGGTKQILISCAGVGMGNASRVIAIVEALVGQARADGCDLRCRIVTWGSAYVFLREYKRESEFDFELIEMEGYGTVAPSGGLKMARAFLRNVRFLRGLIKERKPDLILLDSDYHFPAYFGVGCPIVYIGQASDILERARRDSYRPSDWRERLNFYLREKLDVMLQRVISNWVLVPSFSADVGSNGKVRRIPLIVRKEFLEKTRPSSGPDSVGILLSGSGIEKSAFLSVAERFGLKILAPSERRETSTVPSRASALDQFDIIFSQGGLSSISECIARSKFLVVFPMRYHPEQILNAAEVEQLGLGMSSDIGDLDRFPELLERIRRQRSEAKKTRVGCDGAQVAARFIFQAISGSRQTPSPG